MTYAQNSLEEINDKYQEIFCIHRELLLLLERYRATLKNEKAREYLRQGVGRRLKTLAQCITNIFTIFPPERESHLTPEELTNLAINLHAFFINIAGVFDNLGWVYVYENNLLGKEKEGKIGKHGVGLFKKQTQDVLINGLKKYITSEKMKAWYEDYSKNYRDSLAHRIPLYVPPSLLTKDEGKEYNDIESHINIIKLNGRDELDKNLDTIKELRNKQEKLGIASHFISHSINEGCQPVYFHAQIISDHVTIEETINIFCKDVT